MRKKRWELDFVDVGGRVLPFFLALGKSRDVGGWVGCGAWKELVVNSTKALMCVKI